MSNEVKATWHEIDPATLQPAVGKLYNAYKAQYATMKKAREDFEAAMKGAVELPKGKRLAVAYNFGKLSVASVDDTPRKASSKATSLAAALS